MIAEIDGLKIKSESDFHVEISRALRLGYYYGNNLDALWDVLTRDVERPVSLVWKNANASQSIMPVDFDKIVGILREVEKQDADYGASDRFELIIQ